MNRMKRFKKYLFGMIIGIFLLQVSVFADVDKLNISQILQEGKDVYLYVNALNSEELPVSDTLTVEQLHVELINQDNSTILNVDEAVPFHSLNNGISYIFCIDVSKSVTEAEMQEIRSSIASFVSQMSAYDHARIITIGTDITVVCDYTQDKNALSNAANSIAVVANDTYLYKGISYALDGQRKSVDSRPQRSAIILFSDGMDDSDGASGYDQVMNDIAQVRVPIYVVGLQGNSKPDLTNVSNIARNSGGAVYSYNDMGISEALQVIGSTMRGVYRLHVTPEEEYFGKQNDGWIVSCEMSGYSTPSSKYVFNLSKKDVVFETPVPTEAPTATPEPTATAVPTATAIPTPEPTEAPEASLLEQVTGFLKENIILCAAGGLILIALLILLILLIQRRKNKKKFIIEDTPPSVRREFLPGGYEETLDDKSFEDRVNRAMQGEYDGSGYDDEKTMDEKDFYDDERTVDEEKDFGLRMSFEISFDGMTDTVVRSLTDELVLGRGTECDVDVVLGSMQEFRKQISRHHAFIINRPDGVYIKDNGKNKTYLNGVELNGEILLRNEDVIQMGRARVKVTMTM